MPGLARPRVEIAGVEPVRARQGERQARRIGGREDEVDVIGHQAIGPDGDAEPQAGFGEPVPVERVIVRPEEQRLVAIGALRDMMGSAGNDDAGDAGHGAGATRAS